MERARRSQSSLIKVDFLETTNGVLDGNLAGVLARLATEVGPLVV